MPISALPFAPQLKLHLDKMTAFENGAEWHPCLSVPHLLTTLNHYPLNLKRSGTIIPVGAGPLVATPGSWSRLIMRGDDREYHREDERVVFTFKLPMRSEHQ